MQRKYYTNKTETEIIVQDFELIDVQRVVITGGCVIATKCPFIFTKRFIADSKMIEISQEKYKQILNSYLHFLN